MRLLVSRLIALVLIAVTISACNLKALPGTQAKLAFGARATLFDAPFPSEELRDPGQNLGLDLFPNPRNVDLITKALTLLRAGQDAFSSSSGIFIAFDGPIDTANLPDVPGSLARDAKVFLLCVDPKSPDFLKFTPAQVGFTATGSPYGADNLLTVLPYQGFPMRAGTAYAAVVLRSLNDASGQPLGVPVNMRRILLTQQPDRPLSAQAFGVYREAVDALAQLGISPSGVAALAAFTTADPTSELITVRDDALKNHPLPLPATPLKRIEIHPDFCLYKSTVQMPDYQAGTPPFSSAGGRWTFSSDGSPIYQRSEQANLFVTLPRRAQPAAGWPAVLYIRAGGSGEVPLVNRGPQSCATCPDAPGEGPAMHFAQVGWAAVEVDGPLGGLRNTTGGDEEYLVFNFLNPDALRDNVRESAVELSLMAHALNQLTLNSNDCDPLTQGAQHFDPGHLALFGHSTGATIAPLAASIEPRIGALILSGAGGSYLNNILYKKKPIDVLPVAEALLGYTGTGRVLDVRDPVLSLIQWATEPADPQLYAHKLIREPIAGAAPKQLLMFQGIVDHYILPPMANSLSLPIGLDLAGPALDETAPELAPLPHLRSLLPLSGRAQIRLPASSNVSIPGGGSVTAVLVQEPGDQVDDGHEVVFQTEAPKHQYRCFLQSWAQSGAAKVPPAGLSTDPCP
jgi:hypothetical protein